MSWKSNKCLNKGFLHCFWEKSVCLPSFCFYILRLQIHFREKKKVGQKSIESFNHLLENKPPQSKTDKTKLVRGERVLGSVSFNNKTKLRQLQYRQQNIHEVGIEIFSRCGSSSLFIMGAWNLKKNHSNQTECSSVNKTTLGSQHRKTLRCRTGGRGGGGHSQFQTDADKPKSHFRLTREKQVGDFADEIKSFEEVEK